MKSNRLNPQQISYTIKSSNDNKQELDMSSTFKGVFEDPANGIIFMKQCYEKLFYNQTKLLECPIESIQIGMYDEGEKTELLLKLLILKRQIQLVICWGNSHIESREVEEILFPSPSQAYDFLEKKIWVFFNRINRSMKVYSGDITRPELIKCLFEYSFQTQEEKRRKLETEQRFPKPYDQNDLSGKVQKVENPFEKIKTFQVYVTSGLVKQNKKQKKRNHDTDKIELKEILAVKLINTDRIYDPILVEKASFLKPKIPGIFSVPDELRMLFNTLQPMSIKYLPESEKNIPDYECLTSGRWRYLPQAVQHSLTQTFSLGPNKKDEKMKNIGSEFIPFGILNHLFLLKTQRIFTDYNASNKNPQQILKDIYQRMGYIRMELLTHEGLSPGSMAVLEIWPPYSSSSIHNHGHSYGLIKVLSGQLRVQNFIELTFKDLNSQPYMENDYKQDQYTWFSDQSYGIHRVINPYPECCVSIQSYYHYKTNMKTMEYFSFLEHDIPFEKQREVKQNRKKQKETIIKNKDSYTEYYPQNDWENYLTKRMLRKDHEKDDEYFIDRVIEYYGLGKINQPNFCFESFVATMKREYDLINEKIKIPPTKK